MDKKKQLIFQIEQNEIEEIPRDRIRSHERERKIRFVCFTVGLSSVWELDNKWE